MKIDIKQFLLSDELTFYCEGEVEDLSCDKSNQLRLIFPIKYKLQIFKVDDELFMDLEADYSYNTECARCLKDITPSNKAYLEVDLLNEDDDNHENDYIVLIDSSFDLDECLYSLVETSMPLRDLCDDECKGVCPRCGTNLNSENCGCQTQEIDPRMAGLLEFFNRDEEVL